MVLPLVRVRVTQPYPGQVAALWREGRQCALRTELSRFFLGSLPHLGERGKVGSACSASAGEMELWKDGRVAALRREREGWLGLPRLRG